MEQLKNWGWLKALIGFILMGAFVVAFILDRIILIPLIWIEEVSIQVAFKNLTFMLGTLRRVGVVAAIVLIYQLIAWIW